MIDANNRSGHMWLIVALMLTVGFHPVEQIYHQLICKNVCLIKRVKRVSCEMCFQSSMIARPGDAPCFDPRMTKWDINSTSGLKIMKTSGKMLALDLAATFQTRLPRSARVQHNCHILMNFVWNTQRTTRPVVQIGCGIPASPTVGAQSPVQASFQLPCLCFNGSTGTYFYYHRKFKVSLLVVSARVICTGRGRHCYVVQSQARLSLSDHRRLQ